MKTKSFSAHKITNNLQIRRNIRVVEITSMKVEVGQGQEEIEGQNQGKNQRTTIM